MAQATPIMALMGCQISANVTSAEAAMDIRRCFANHTGCRWESLIVKNSGVAAKRGLSPLFGIKI
ncbi:hypothetical protein N836_25935 [Leptolyngbya sp. Heron Island J]|nr:hypothetical protein N836_25935 [Leptolyngbya sp. Heron Island J]